MGKFLDTYNHPKLNQENINHLNSPVTYNEIEDIRRWNELACSCIIRINIMEMATLPK
jgi:hypothetical protein